MGVVARTHLCNQSHLQWSGVDAAEITNLPMCKDHGVTARYFWVDEADKIEVCIRKNTVAIA